MATPQEWYQSLPPVTRSFGTLCFLTTVATQLRLLSPSLLYLDYELVWKKFQVWRLVTNFVYIGGFSMRFVITLLMIVQYGVKLEQNKFQNRTADFLFMMFFGMAVFLLAAFLLPFPLYFCSSSLVFMLVYLWARFFPEGNVSLWGLFNIKALYLPWALMAINFMFGQSPVPDLMGILVGHVYYFLVAIYPTQSGRQLLTTPAWVHQLVDKWGVARAPAGFVMREAFSVQAPASGAQRQPQQPAAAPAGQRAFTGRSYRLDR